MPPHFDEVGRFELFLMPNLYTATLKMGKGTIALAFLVSLIIVALNVFFTATATRALSPNSDVSLTTPSSSVNADSRARAGQIRETNQKSNSLPDAVTSSIERNNVLASESVDELAERQNFDYETQLRFEENYLQQVVAYERALDAGYSASPGNLLEISASDEIAAEYISQHRDEQLYLEYTSLYEQAAEFSAPMLTAPLLDVSENTQDYMLYREQEEVTSRYTDWLNATVDDPTFYAQSEEHQATDAGVPDFPVNSENLANTADADAPN